MQKLRTYFSNPYTVLYVIFTYFILFALIVDTPYEIFRGLIAIILAYDLLITDYIAVGGVGATLVNAALVNLVFIACISRVQSRPSGGLVMSLWLLAGFAFFGKNIVNIWPIIFGGYLYAKYNKEPFAKYAVATVLATALGPSVTQMAMLEHIPLIPRLILAGLFGTAVGFVTPPISANLMNVHQGFNLYNIGFTAGILAILTRVFVIAIGGGEINPVFIWSYEYKITLTIFMTITFVFLIFAGWLCGENHRENLQALFRRTGQAPSDYLTDYGAVTYINMGLLGLSAMVLMLAINSDINGPVMGSIFTIVGFGCFGKHMKNVWPVIAGCLIAGGFTQIYTGSNPSAAIAVLLVSCLAPIVGKYGWKWGVIAGIIHLHVAANVVIFSGGFNLYNNGLAGGFVMMFLLPVIRAVRRE